METNGNGWIKPIFVGVAVLVLATAIIGSASNTINNSINQRGLQVAVAEVKEDVDEQKANVAKIPVMDERIKDIKEDVGKILDALERNGK